jgi:hypothetical protein
MKIMMHHIKPIKGTAFQKSRALSRVTFRYSFFDINF